MIFRDPSMQANISDLLVEAATLLLVGMSVVFLFLSLLIGAIQFISALNSRFPSKEVELSSSNMARTNIKPHVPDGVPQSTVAAITAAIHQFRKSN